MASRAQRGITTRRDGSRPLSVPLRSTPKGLFPWGKTSVDAFLKEVINCLFTKESNAYG